MKANKNRFVSASVDKETKEWIDNHPLSTTQLINYGLHSSVLVEKTSAKPTPLEKLTF